MRKLILISAFFITQRGFSSPQLEVSILNKPNQEIAHQLSKIRNQILSIEKKLITGTRGKLNRRHQILKVKKLLKLHNEERSLSLQRIDELESLIEYLEKRRVSIHDRMNDQKIKIKNALKQMLYSQEDVSHFNSMKEWESYEMPRRKLLATLSDRYLQLLGALKIDLQEADQLEAQIIEERQQLASIFDRLEEKKEIIRLHERLEVSILKKNYKKRLSQLENYHSLKESENRLVGLLNQLNARVELENLEEKRKQVQEILLSGDFFRKKGKLRAPVDGKILQTYGKVYDAQTKLHVFKKGLEYETAALSDVKAIASGRVAYAGPLSGYGQVLLIDHGARYYSLLGRLGELEKVVGDVVVEGERVGQSSAQGEPVYFEIRSRNVAVNPLKWLQK
ncbi:MAG: hypothetical protein CL678_14880 [Bdellovibrionaceae bacterium]|nr:hypothetical protein [Pseudobdellovibrionaceae bacterium]|tara:strand:+ start:4301 stop:5482 length:1182 start_codon:yes stop_codon:yes gene_type:complete